MAWSFFRKPTVPPPDVPVRKPAPVTAVGLAQPINHELIRWKWDDQAKKPIAEFVNGPPEEPPDLRRRVYHSAYSDRAQPRSWLFPDGRRGSWWDY